MSPVATSRLPLGTLLQDSAGRVGSITDYGLNEDESRVYYLADERGEWKADAADLTQVEP